MSGQRPKACNFFPFRPQFRASRESFSAHLSRGSWVNVSTAATSALAQRTLSVGEKIRWVPPAGVSGDRAGFKVKARDGALNSAVTAQVTINLAPA